VDQIKFTFPDEAGWTPVDNSNEKSQIVLKKTAYRIDGQSEVVSILHPNQGVRKRQFWKEPHTMTSLSHAR
jgi:hypothetical protein